jgi:hypothetical protein
MLMMVFNKERGHRYCEELFIWKQTEIKHTSYFISR